MFGRHELGDALRAGTGDDVRPEAAFAPDQPREELGWNVVGTRDGGTVTASLRQQSDGSLRVQFDSRAASDPDLISRVSRSYERRMGR